VQKGWKEEIPGMGLCERVISNNPNTNRNKKRNRHHHPKKEEIISWIGVCCQKVARTVLSFGFANEDRQSEHSPGCREIDDDELFAGNFNESFVFGHRFNELDHGNFILVAMWFVIYV
jgi:hypothetical protein